MGSDPAKYLSMSGQMEQIIKYLKSFSLPISLIVLLTFGQAIADLSLPNFMARIVDEGIAKQNSAFILHSGGIMLLVSLAGITCAVTAGYLASRVALGLGKNLRNKLFGHVTGYSLAEFDRFGTSSLITRTTNDVQQIQNTTFMMLRMMLRAPLMCIGGIIMAVGKDGSLALILLAILPVIITVILVVSRKAIPIFRLMQKRLDQLNLVLRESLVGIRIIRAFSRVGYERRRFGRANNDLTQVSIRVNRLMAIMNPSITLSMNLMSIAIVWLAAFRIDRGDLMIGDMMAFLQYAMQIFMALMMLTMMFIMLPRALASAERVNEVFSARNAVADPQTPVVPAERKGVLKLENVTFRYDSAQNPAVDHVSFEVREGETIAVIGGTGSGKSTLINLILRFYDVESGSISVDGTDIRLQTQEELRSRIGLVSQKSVLFAGDIYHNIRMGKPDATDEEVHHACEVAQASDFIHRMPDGYRSHISRGGTNLSGGQKQRLSIARAIVRKPELYLFDDSFSALDYKTDAQLQTALKKETRLATVLIVAQRVASIRYADRILVMDKGAVVGTGTHRELMQSNAIYREIVLSQLSQEEIS